MHTWIQDLRFAVRSLRRRPGFTAAAALTLALGIGANTGVFSIVNGVLLRPFPYAEADRLVTVGTTHPTDPGEMLNLSYPDFEAIRDQVETLDGVAAWDWNPYNLRGEEGALFVGGERVSAEYFEVIGVDPILGRTFQPEDDRPGAGEVIVLSETLWRNEFGADPDVLGRTVRLDGAAHTVVGVVPDHAAWIEGVRLWVPLALDAEASPRGSQWLEAIGRLAPGVTLEQATAELDAVARRLQDDYPETNRERGLAAEPLRAAMTADERPLLLLLLGAVGLVLLIACANVANLLLARATARRRELAIRGAMGASRGRILRQLLTESAVLSALGTGLGLVLGVWGTEAVLSWLPNEIPPWISFEPDLRVFGFAAGAATVAVALFGLPPALSASRPDIKGTLKRTAGAATATRGTGRMQGGLVVAEVALSLTLLVTAGLMIRSLLNLSDVDPGFETNGRAVATLALPSAAYPDDEARRTFARELLREVAAAPGVESAGIVSRFPLRGSSNAMVFTVEGQSADGQRGNPYVLTNSVSPSYFEAMGIALRRGRPFSSADQAASPPVAIINRAMADRYWPDEDPVGRRVKFGPPDAAGDWMEVVGVVDDVRHYALERRPSVQMYLPYEQ
ncbi:MAG: ABC transporter permease, partial [Gemmatimonadota bacterium]